MTTYALQKAIYEYLNPKGRGDAPTLDRDVLRTRYALTEAELDALVEADIRALYGLGVHPVLLNSYARARVPRDRYRAALAALEASAPAGAGGTPGRG